MTNFKWGYGVVVSLAIGMTGCYMDGQRSQQMDHMSAHNHKMTDHKEMNGQQANANAKAMHTSHASASAAKEPIQQVAPGPKRKAAPQLPVIQ